MKLRLCLIAACLVLAGVFAATRAKAITLIPPSLEYGAKPGETLTTKVKLFNETAAPVVLTPSTDVFVAGDEQGSPKFKNTPNEDIASWIKVSPDPISLDAGDRVEVPVTIAVPANADPGGHYGALFFTTAAKSAAGSSGVAISNKIGALVIIRVEGTVRESGKIQSFATESAGFHAHLPIDFTIRFKNEGNVHLRPTGEVVVRNMLGGTSATLPVNNGQGAVLPDSFRQFTTAWEKVPGATGKTNWFQQISEEWKNFALGPYTAEVDLKFGLANDKTTTATLHFWVFPWHLIALIAILIVFAVLLLIWLIRRYNRWILSRARVKK